MLRASQVLDSRNTVELLFATTSDAVFAVGLEDGRLLQANEHLELLTGFPLAELLGQSIERLSPEEVPSRERPLDKEVLAQPGLYEEVAMARADGFTAITTLRVAHLDDDCGSTIAVCMARDETERRMLKRELITKHVALLAAHRDLEARQREIGELTQRLAAVSRQAMLAEIVAEVAHALNNPLGALMSSLRVLGRLGAQLPEDERPRYERVVKRCEGLGHRMARVVEDLRVTCRQGASQHLQARCDLAAEVRSAVAIVEHRIPSDVKVELDVPQTVTACVPADEANHAIVNLVANALEAVGSQGHVRIRCGSEEGRAIVVVDDDGPGIDESIVDKIFDPFFSTKGQRLGTGVGLSMVRRMTMLFGGSVSAEPHGELGGASFRIELPGGEPCIA